MTDLLDLLAIRERCGLHQARIIDDETVRSRAAVATILRDGGAAGVEVLLIRRAEHEGDPWSGHMAFPGGRVEAHDPDLVATVVRETHEEIGVDLGAQGELITRLDDVQAIARSKMTGMVISHFVFALREPIDLDGFTPNHEVAEIVWAPLGPMARGEIATTIDYPLQADNILRLPGYLVGERIVWGLTYQMLQAFFSVVGAR